MPLQEAPEGLNPLVQALGVVESVDAEHQVLVAEVALEMGRHRARLPARGGALEGVDVDPDREGPDLHRPPLPDHPTEEPPPPVPLDSGAEEAAARGEEVLRVARGVKPDQARP